MKKIGHGVQYNVYDTGNDRVKKFPSSFLQKIYRFHVIAPKYKIYSHLLHNIKTSIGSAKIARLSIHELKEHLGEIDVSLLGNPTIENDGSYEQDKTLLLGDVLNSSDFEKQKELIDQFVNHILDCWDYGFGDVVFNFNLNSGVTIEGKVVLIDLGELTWNKEEIRGLVETKYWEKRSSFARLKNIELKNYIREQFNEKITLKNLDKHWGSKVIHSIQ